MMILPLFGTRWETLCVLAAGVIFCLVLALYLRRAAENVRARMTKRLAERERTNLEIEDTLLQTVEGLILRFQLAADRIPQNDPARGALEEALAESEGVLEQLRARILGPGSGINAVPSELPQAFAALYLELKREHTADFSVLVNGEPRELEPIVRDEIYRIGRDAITNSFQGASPGKCETEINYECTQLRIGFRDDGRGMDTRVRSSNRHPGTWGLPGMQERALRIGAHLEVWSRSGIGTEVELRVPASRAYRDRERTSRWQWLCRIASSGR
jgi:signal transduction histidine kinase